MSQNHKSQCPSKPVPALTKNTAHWHAVAAGGGVRRTMTAMTDDRWQLTDVRQATVTTTTLMAADGDDRWQMTVDGEYASRAENYGNCSRKLRVAEIEDFPAKNRPKLKAEIWRCQNNVVTLHRHSGRTQAGGCPTGGL